MLRQLADFPGDNVGNNSTVDIIVTWNEVRMLYILYYDVYFVYYSHLYHLVLL